MNIWRKGCLLFVMAVFFLVVHGCAHESVFTQTDLHLYSGSGQDPKPAESDSLVCISYNIAFSEKLDQALLDLADCAAPRNPDILLLQEMDAEGVAYMAEQLGLNYCYYPSFIHPHHGRLFGNAVLSPWPLNDPRFVRLPHANPITENYRTALAVNVSSTS